MTIRSTTGLRDGATPPCALPRTTVLAVTLVLGACGGGSGDEPSPLASPSSGVPDDEGGSPVSVVTDVNAGADIGDGSSPGDSPTSPGGMGGDPAIAGDIARVGIVAVGDTNGLADGDLRATFSRLSTSVGPEAFGAALVPDASVCTVTDADGGPNQDTLSVALYLPRAEGVASESIGAGDAVLLSSGAGSWAELQGGRSGRFYTLSSADAVPGGPVPDGLLANVTGDEFPAFVDAALPDVAPLAEATHGGGDVTPGTRFTWRAGTAANARIRIEAMSAGSFFVEDGTAVSCLVPDTGEFTFPARTRAALGATFAGAEPDLSRVAIESVREGDALLILVRESFAR